MPGTTTYRCVQAGSTQLPDGGFLDHAPGDVHAFPAGTALSTEFWVPEQAPATVKKAAAAVKED